MTTMTKEVYQAFRAAGVPEDTASAAAEAIEESRESDRLRAIENDLSDVKGEAKLLRWMLGFNLAISSAVLLKLVL